MTQPLKLGTRGSPLALVQANMVREALCAAHGWDRAMVEIVPIRTTGDRRQDVALAEIGGKALWTKELDRALLAGEIDFAVHSMKDVETGRPDTISIAAMLPRADVRDRIIGADSVAALRDGAVVGTSSPRRVAQVKRLRPDVVTILLRGNVDTRLAKVTAGEVDATLLAAAGLERLGRVEVGSCIPIDVMLPAPAQGAVGIEARTADERVRTLLAAIDHAPTHRCVLLERGLLAVLQADCHSPVAALATLAEDDGSGAMVTLRGELFAEDGSAHVEGTVSGKVDDTALATRLATDLLERAPPGVRALFAG